jgi:membrane dipeptidase
MTLEQIEMVLAMVDHYGATFELARTAADIERIHRAGKIAALIGVEGGHSIENSLGVLRQLYRLGARYMTLTHSDTLDWVDSATDEEKHGGLSPFGEQVVGEMNRLGMLVDLSHVATATMKDALRITRAPVIFSHSSARALADHPRNVADGVLRLVAQNGGLVMVNFYSGFIVPASAKLELQYAAYQQQLESELGDEQQIKVGCDSGRTSIRPSAAQSTTSWITSTTSPQWRESTTSAWARTTTASPRYRSSWRM